MSEEKKGWWSGMRSRFYQSKEDKPEESKAETKAPDSERQPLMDQLDQLEKMLPTGIKDNEKIISELLEKIKAYGTYFFALGRKNGVIGNQSQAEAEALAAAYADYIKIELRTEVKGVQSALDKDKKYKEEEKNTIAGEYKDERDYMNYLETQRRYNSNSFSWPLALLYLIIGIALFVSDIPLALNLISSGFNMLTSTSPAYSLDQLFVNPIGVFINNWEAFFTAFGVAFITIYIKMFYDDYVGFAEGANAIRKDKMQGMYTDKNMTERESKIKFWIRVAILLAVISMLGVLALFRSASVHLIDPNFQDTTLSKTVFFFITLMLPIISGICFSVSLKTFQNINRRRKVVETVERLRRKLEEATRLLDEAEKKFEVVGELMDQWVKKEEFYSFIKKFLMAYCQLGYEQGLREPEIYDGETDYMRRVEILRNKVLARNTFQKIKEQSP